MTKPIKQITTENISPFNPDSIRPKKKAITKLAALNLSDLVKSGMGIGFISKFLADEPVKAGVIGEIPLTDPPKKRSICLIENRTKSCSIVSEKLKEYLLFQSTLDKFQRYSGVK